MSSEPRGTSSGGKETGSEASESVEDPDGTPGLTIALPDGSTSVADAIATNREMLSNPQEYEIATEEDITHLSEAIESVSTKADKAHRQSGEQAERISELQETIEAQRAQIDELQSMVTSLAEILGTEAEWDTFDAE